jgi:hypothetical protein
VCKLKPDKAHEQLVVAARKAGMAEVAIGVLHNVGNVLNSVNISSSIVVDRLRQLKSERLSKVVALLRQHEKDLEISYPAILKANRSFPTWRHWRDIWPRTDRRSGRIGNPFQKHRAHQGHRGRATELRHARGLDRTVAGDQFGGRRLAHERHHPGAA